MNIALMQKKEKLLKKQQREALLLNSYLTADGVTSGRSLRHRKSVTYTFGKSFRFQTKKKVLPTFLIIFVRFSELFSDLHILSF